MHSPTTTHDQRPTTNAGDSSPKILALLSFAVSSLFLAHYYRYAQILLSGDAVAHINIARRVFDSRTPGPTQLGTVWLPLQHVLTMPFIVSTSLWSSGLGGAIPSMAGYVLGVVGMYRLVRDSLHSRAAAWIAAVIYGANPNLLYVQTTALNEPLSMALMIWSVVWFAEFATSAQCSVVSAQNEPGARGSRSLVLCGWALLANILIRYDGWFNGCAFLVATAIVLLIAHRHGRSFAEFKKPVAIFTLLVAAGPIFWFAWNAAIFGNPLDFMNGPYSAKAIEERSTPPGAPHHPGWHAPGVAALYYFRSLDLNLGSGRLLVGPPNRTAFAPTASPGRWEKPWLPVAVAGIVVVIVLARAELPMLLLWLPAIFYPLAIAWGGVPVFIPVWWPFSYYNTRYALELLPAIAAFWGAAAWGVMRLPTSAKGSQKWGLKGWSVWTAAVMVAALWATAASYASIWRSVPITLREVRANGAARYALDRQLADVLRRVPPNASILMYLGDHGGALERAPVPLRRTINEGDYKLWDAALRNPAAAADYIVAADGDPVAEAVHEHPQGLALVGVIEAPWQKAIRIYRPVNHLPSS